MNVKRYSLVGMALWLLMLATSLQAQSAAQIVRKGNESYRAGNFDEALQQYQQPLLEGPDNPVILYNKANCFYKLDDLEQAMNLYRQVSAESKDMDLVARAKFNLGNCYFQQGMKQRDSDLQKAVEAFTTSIHQYREVLKIHPDDAEAAHNIAVIRLIMKDILDQLKKQQEQQKQQQQQQDLAEKIKKLLERQTALAQQTGQLPQNPADQKQEDFNQLAEQQQTLRKDTADAQTEARQMIQQQAQAQAQQNGQATPDPNTAQKMEQNRQILETVTQELSLATENQQTASDQLSQTQVKPALEAETAAAENLKKALEAFPKQPPQPQQQQQKQQQKQQQEQQKKEQEKQQEQQQQEQQENQQQEQPQPQEEMKAPDATAQQILDEERRRNEEKQKERIGGYKPVERDW